MTEQSDNMSAHSLHCQVFWDIIYRQPMSREVQCNHSMTDAAEMLYLIHKVGFIACKSVDKDVCWFTAWVITVMDKLFLIHDDIFLLLIIIYLSVLLKVSDSVTQTFVVNNVWRVEEELSWSDVR